VLSTIHTNNAIGVIPRLIDMGIDPYLIAPTLKMAIAQRLAKTLCPNTGTEESVDAGTKARITDIKTTLPSKYHHRIPEITTVLHPEPTPTCATGYRGRTAVTEVLEITDAIQELILQNASEEDIYSEARKGGFMTMPEDAMMKALKHEIPQEEMITFVSQVGLIDEETDELTVDNPSKSPEEQAIMQSNEETLAR
jgi:type II secretory ATPase GspE/PulE/Tfp pilus assembly ATPase PilB-like protein